MLPSVLNSYRISAFRVDMFAKPWWINSSVPLLQKTEVKSAFLPLWDGEVGKNINFDRPKVNQRRHSQLLAKKFAQTLHPAHKKTWRSDSNKEFGIVHFGHQTIENTALPATWLRQVNPQPQNRRERAYSHRQNALFSILFTPPQCWNEIISPYSLITTSQRRFLELISH